MQRSRNYAFFRTYMRFGLKYVFYRKFQTAGYQEYVYANRHKATIITADHQNSLIDALNLAGGVYPERQPFFMTRSDVFGSKFDFILYSWKMRPIYRRQDNIVDVVKANEEIFDEMVQELGNGDCLLIFPEGNHGRVRRLRPLKKGFARIGFQAEQQNNFALDLQILPTGIVYWEHLHPGADLLVKFGPPLRLADYVEEFQQNENQALIRIRKDLFNAMKELIHHITTEEFYDVVDAVREAAGPGLLLEAGLDPDDLDERFLREKEVIETLESQISDDNPAWETFAEEVRQYQAKLAEYSLTDAEVGAVPEAPWLTSLKGALFVLFWPLFKLGSLVHWFPYWFGNKQAVENFKDDHFHSSIRFVVPLFIYPVYWLLLSLLTGLVLWSGWAILMALAALVLSAKFTLSYRRAWLRFQKRWRWLRLKATDPEAATDLLAHRESWWKQVKTWLTTKESTTAG